MLQLLGQLFSLPEPLRLQKQTASSFTRVGTRTILNWRREDWRDGLANLELKDTARMHLSGRQQ
jgi:hypothetical protein